MLNQAIILIVIATLLSGCSNPDEQPLPTQKKASEAKEETGLSPESLLLEEETTDYRKQYTSLPPKDDRWINFGDFRSPRPPTWFWIAPKSSFVLSNYIVPGIEDSDLATFSITRFSEGEGGDLALNLKRWESKFNTFQGAPVRASVESIMINTHDSTIVELRGEYMGAGAAWHKPDHTLLIVIIANESDTYYFKLLGPTETVSEHRDSLLSLIANIEKEGQ